ncbi:hypothetical protein BU592_04115 [Staphylococcus arlettae]|uniref:hypothetical protein n=1 Tax=Staphylococcus TaxID=1279 RepID=UPI000D19B64D|nr:MULTISPECIES: hypothetical protein [Staphylococcus]PTH34747.1 hypothetical protein BU592_04115 [Staphylococcus arlettae]RIM60470.1 hypothetical protein BU603_00495 [Staphylococcus arlettae]UXU52563.1 hypothetical protein MUA71_00355 [Staphylococcus arlettae]HDE9610278.1 hypothetical protein [Staphylococcus aureus]
MKYKPIRVIQLYGASKRAAKQKYSGETFIFNDLVNQVGTFNCTTNEIREVGRMFGAWERKGCDAPIKRISNKSPILYQKIRLFNTGGKR